MRDSRRRRCVDLIRDDEVGDVGLSKINVVFG